MRSAREIVVEMLTSVGQFLMISFSHACDPLALPYTVQWTLRKIKEPNLHYYELSDTKCNKLALQNAPFGAVCNASMKHLSSLFLEYTSNFI